MTRMRLYSRGHACALWYYGSVIRNESNDVSTGSASTRVLTAELLSIFGSTRSQNSAVELSSKPIPSSGSFLRNVHVIFVSYSVLFYHDMA